MSDINFTRVTVRTYIAPEFKVLCIKTHHTILSGSPFSQETETEGMETIYD